MFPWNSIESNRDDEQRFERQVKAVERFLWLFLLGLGSAVIILGIVSMVLIGGGRAHLPGRLILAVAALLILGAIDTQLTRLAQRRRPLLAPDPPAYRRFIVASASTFLLAAVVLLGIALFLP